MHGGEDEVYSVGHDDVVVDTHNQGHNAHGDTYTSGSRVQLPTLGWSLARVLAQYQLQQVLRLANDQLQDDVRQQEGSCNNNKVGASSCTAQNLLNTF